MKIIENWIKYCLFARIEIFFRNFPSSIHHGTNKSLPKNSAINLILINNLSFNESQSVDLNIIIRKECPEANPDQQKEEYLY